MAAGSREKFFELLDKSHIFSEVFIAREYGAVPGGLGTLNGKV